MKVNESIVDVRTWNELHSLKVEAERLAKEFREAKNAELSVLWAQIADAADEAMETRRGSLAFIVRHHPAGQTVCPTPWPRPNPNSVNK